DGAARVQRPSADHGLEGVARDELEHEEEPVLILADFIERRDVRMGQRRGRARLAQEAVAPIHIVGHGGHDHFDRHRAAQARVALTSSISSYWNGYELDRAGWSPRTMAFALGALFCVPGVLWLLILSRWREPPDEPLEQPAPNTSGGEGMLEGRIR